MSAVTMVDARALPAEIGPAACTAMVEEHYEPGLAVTMRGHDADKSTMVPQADAAALFDHERYRSPLPHLAQDSPPLGQP
jgi:hypothetical protein